MNYCLSCGTNLPTLARFCSYCGQKIIAEENTKSIGSPQLDRGHVAPEISQRLEATLKHPQEDAPPIENPLQNASIESIQPSHIIEEVEQNGLQVAKVPSNLVAKRYKLIRKVGNGNMSEVYQAEDTRHKNKIVAVKLLNTHHKDAIKQEMYLRETKALEQLEHPNIIKHLDYGWSDELSCHYIVLEYIPQTLVDVIAKHSDYEDRSWCWSLMRDMADALVHAHSKGIIHRDLKSTNILITEQNTAKLTDFGISLLRFEIRTGITLSGYWSNGYAAPEQRRMQQTTNQSDIYSLGCVFYHMLSGQEPPLSGLTSENIQALKLQPMIERMLQMMLEEDAQNRFESAERLARFLETTKKLQTYPDLFFRMTRKAYENLFDASLIKNSTLEDACRFLNTEFVQDGFPKEVQIKLENNSIHIFTDTMKLICIKDDKLPLFTVAAVHTYVYAPQHEDQRNHVPFYRYHWQFLKYSHELPGEKQVQAQTSLEDVLHKLSQRKQEEKESRRQKSDRKDFTKIWNKVLDLQQQLLDESPKLEYIHWHKEGNTITFQLKNAVSDAVEWPESAPIGFLSSETRMESVGLLMGYSGASVQVSATQGSTQERTASSKKIPSSGTIGLFQIQTSAAMEKQRRALEMLISGGTLNPHLPDVLLDLSTADFETLDDSIVFYQELGEDQKSAVRKALATQDIFLLQGPPGTGKTTTLAEIILQILKEKPDARILVSSQSNVAVNHVLSRVTNQPEVGDIGILRIGRPERIGPGAQEWTPENRLNTWRDDVILRTKSVIHDLEEKVQTQQNTFRPTIYPQLRDDLEQCKIWLEELAGDLADLADYEQRRARLSERLDHSHALSDKQTQEIQIELEKYSEISRTKRVYISETLELVRSYLPNEVWREHTFTQLTDERTHLYQIVTNILNPDSTASKEEKLLDLVRNWQRVFGKPDDFAEPLYERASILAATCLITGARQLRDVEFDWAIIDEGGRATATELLVPLVRSRRSIIVGDEQQLPPMVDTDLRTEALSRLNLTRDDLEKSLFETLVTQGREEELPAVQMLTEQYRMHPAIGEMISQIFYEGKLKHATNHLERNHNLHWLDRAVVWYSTTKLPKHFERSRGPSFSNLTEVDAIVHLVHRLEQSYSEIGGKKRDVAIITPYNEQILLLRERIRPTNLKWHSLTIEIATVDAFQGRDSNIVIYSTVRSNPKRELGFLKDRRRLNVALSRAQQLLIIVGDVAMLESGRTGKEENPYRKLVRYMRNNPDDCLIQNLKPEDLHE